MVATPLRGFSESFFLDDKTSVPVVFNSCSFISRAHFETSSVMARERSLTIGGGGLVNFGGGLCFFGRPFGVGHNFMGPRFIGEGYNFWAPFIKTLGDVHKWVLCY